MTAVAGSNVARTEGTINRSNSTLRPRRVRRAGANRVVPRAQEFKPKHEAKKYRAGDEKRSLSGWFDWENRVRKPPIYTLLSAFFALTFMSPN